MKLLFLVGCLVASAVGGAIYPKVVGGYAAGNAGVEQAKANEGLRDWASDSNQEQKWASEGQKYGRRNTGYDDAKANEAAKAQQTGSDYGSRASNWDNSADAASRYNDQASADSYAANRWADSADSNQAKKDQLWAQGSQWYKGNRKNDDVNFSHDKSFDRKDSEDGGFELAESSNSHSLDDFRDKAAAYDRSVNKDAAWASGADAAKANQKSAWGQNAAASSSSWDKFYRDAANAASADGREKDWANKIDQSQGGNRLWSDARRSANDVYKDLATKDGSYKRDAKQYGGEKGVYGDYPYAYGVAGYGGYAAKPDYKPYGKGAAADAAQAWDQASKSGLRQWDDAATEDKTKASYNRDQWLNDRSKGFDRNSKNAASDKGASDWARQSAQSANKADASSADSANAWNKDQAKDTLDENVWKKEAEKYRLSDRDQNKKVYKKWYNNKQRSGDDWENLKKDVDQSEDAFGYDSATKKDWAQAANANKWRSSADANGNKAWAARAASDAKNAKQADWKKDAAGWQNANAASRAADSAKKQGWQNEDWKDNQARNAYDARAEKEQTWDRDSNRANAAAVNSGYQSVAPKVGLTYGSPSYNQGYGSPSYNQGYGYPAYNQGYGSPSYNQGYGSPSYNQGYGRPYGQSYGYPKGNSYGFP